MLVLHRKSSVHSLNYTFSAVTSRAVLSHFRGIALGPQLQGCSEFWTPYFCVRLDTGGAISEYIKKISSLNCRNSLQLFKIHHLYFNWSVSFSFYFNVQDNLKIQLFWPKSMNVSVISLGLRRPKIRIPIIP